METGRATRREGKRKDLNLGLKSGKLEKPSQLSVKAFLADTIGKLNSATSIAKYMKSLGEEISTKVAEKSPRNVEITLRGHSL